MMLLITIYGIGGFNIKLINFVLMIFLALGLLSIPGSVFAQQGSIISFRSFLDVNPSNVFDNDLEKLGG